jgi:hypothetical protein
MLHRSSSNPRWCGRVSFSRSETIVFARVSDLSLLRNPMNYPLHVKSSSNAYSYNFFGQRGTSHWKVKSISIFGWEVKTQWITLYTLKVLQLHNRTISLVKEARLIEKSKVSVFSVERWIVGSVRSPPCPFDFFALRSGQTRGSIGCLPLLHCTSQDWTRDTPKEPHDTIEFRIINRCLVLSSCSWLEFLCQYNGTSSMKVLETSCANLLVDLLITRSDIFQPYSPTFMSWLSIPSKPNARFLCKWRA